LSLRSGRARSFFLRNLVEGAASHSYGIHVGRLAGLPASVIERAKEILARLEGEAGDHGNLRNATLANEPAEPLQMALFGSVERKLREELKRIDVTRITPIEALNLLGRLSEEAKK
jgi:DNA mismatch repair protein MutS